MAIWNARGLAALCCPILSQIDKPLGKWSVHKQDIQKQDTMSSPIEFTVKLRSLPRSYFAINHMMYVEEMIEEIIVVGE